jgi:hypothetical protein
MCRSIRKLDHHGAPTLLALNIKYMIRQQKLNHRRFRADGSSRFSSNNQALLKDKSSARQILTAQAQAFSDQQRDPA